MENLLNYFHMNRKMSYLNHQCILQKNLYHFIFGFNINLSFGKVQARTSQGVGKVLATINSLCDHANCLPKLLHHASCSLVGAARGYIFLVSLSLKLLHQRAHLDGLRTSFEDQQEFFHKGYLSYFLWHHLVGHIPMMTKGVILQSQR